MKEPDPVETVLQAWQPKPSPQEDFPQAVHARIQQTEAKTAGIHPRFQATLPLAASLAIVAGIIAGTTIGNAADEKAMADAYARSIDPVRMMEMPPQP